MRASPHTPGLRQRILKAGGWTVGQHAVELVTRLVSTLIMTRLLFPEAFGQLAAGGSLVAGLILISDFGIRTVILQSPNGEHEDFLRTAWTLQVLRGLVLWLILLVLCALISLPAIRGFLPAYSVFATPQFSAVTATMGLSVAVSGLESTVVPLNMRRLNLRPIVFLDLAARSFSFPAMIAFAWFWPSVWALVSGLLVYNILRMIFSHLLVPGPRMLWRWNGAYFSEIVHFGKWIGLSSAGTFISQQSDQLILGLLLPTSLLGTYSIAKTLIEAPLSLLERLNSSLTVSVMSEVNRRDSREFKKKFYQFRLLFDCFAPLLAGIFFSMGSFIINFLYDKRYEGAGPILETLSLSLIAYPALLFGTALAAAGIPRLAAAISVLQAFSLLTFTTLGYVIGGVTGVIWGIALHKFLPAATILLLAQQRRWFDLYKEFRVPIMFVVGVVAGKVLVMIASALGFTEITRLWR